MYIQITTKCNMTCAHCCNYEGEGQHMSFEMFKKILDRWGNEFKKQKRVISLGGGEPTIHPDFWKIISYSMKYGLPWLATNGKRTEDVLLLNDLAKSGKVYVALSIDQWHDPIDERVVNAFKDGMVKKNKNYWYPIKGRGGLDKREIRTCLNPAYSGRWKEKKRTSCHCKEVRAKPNGLIYMCGCESSDLENCPVIGTVDEGIYEKFKYVDFVNVRRCYRDYVVNSDGYYVTKEKLINDNKQFYERLKNAEQK